MSSTTFASRIVAFSLCCAFLSLGCSSDDGFAGDHHLNGAWVDGVQSGAIKIYITELRFNDGSFEWTWDDDLQQRGVYDTQNGILTVTIENNYGSPQRLLGDPSRPYSIAGDTLTWGGTKFTRK